MVSRVIVLVGVLGASGLAGPTEGRAQILGMEMGLTRSGANWYFDRDFEGIRGRPADTEGQSYTLAATVETDLNRYLGWSTGLRFAHKGFGSSLRVRHLEVPASVRIQTGPGLAAFAGGGGYAGYRVNCRSSSGLLEGGCDAQMKLRRWEVGWAVEGGVRIPFGEGRLELVARRQESLSDMEPSNTRRKMTYRVTTFGLGYRWSPGG